ncbi:MAG TPA: Fe3+-siderophore ABC transporter permease [Pseudogracilibacillus sp.]|nr:Fe3+-siderophore ABC transporter permease [Pseudogracilibacillus sp.]
MIQIIFLIFLWIIPAFAMIFTYRKMDDETKQQFNNDFKQVSGLFAAGLIVFGLLTSLSGIILSLAWLQHLGVMMIFISWLMTSVVSWKKGKTNCKNSMVLAFIAVFVMAVYGYFYII